MTVSLADVSELRGGSHVCWIVCDPGEYVEQATGFLVAGAETGEKPVVFGPRGSDELEALRSVAALSADPREAFLDRGTLDPAAMFAMFEEQSSRARAEGYRGLRLVADMDWLLPAHPATEEMVAFELLLDREARRLQATIVCAYREDSFDAQALTGARCVHPIGVGGAGPPQFLLVAGDDGWCLSGDVDIAVATIFSTAIRTALGAGACVLDVSGVQFIDLPGMRALAAAGASHPVRIVGAPRVFRRCWAAAGLGAVTPSVQLAS